MIAGTGGSFAASDDCNWGGGMGRLSRIGRLPAVMAMAMALLASPAGLGHGLAAEWREMALPKAEATPVANNPLKGFYTWYGDDIVPGPAASEHYFRLAWADIEPREGEYDFSELERALAKLAPGRRIAFGIMPLNTCCSTHHGLDVPADMPTHLAKSFWIKADPVPGRLGGQTYVPDWNDPHYIEQFAKLYAAIGRHFDGDRRIAWIDVRSYGNWGEGHLGGARGYQSGRIPYDDPSVNIHGATPGTLATRLALADAIAKALPHTRLLAMSDDSEVLVHLLKLPTDIPIGIRRDSWGARQFEMGLLPASLSEGDARLVEERWKTAPFVVESYGASKVFEAGWKGIVEQIESQHVSAIGNGNFNVRRWADLPPGAQAALTRAGVRAGYTYELTGIRYRLESEADCTLAVVLSWQNAGIAPPYEAWRTELWLKPVDAGVRPVGPVTVDLPRLMPVGEAQAKPACFVLPEAYAGLDMRLWLRVVDATGNRTMQLPLIDKDALGDYGLGSLKLQ
ncbi:hypothetical protein [Telmatospirillum sp.]|uniref:hypothetical protein n=1 Tax=Telmatospirillum sp. TaxID=2079197 RepID=UPI00284948C7|nr:hypothetical protein [Telmatospirillum sp.]MDR3438728.1 hypothetical protein [Telmatospirillum sp.]